MKAAPYLLSLPALLLCGWLLLVFVALVALADLFSKVLRRRLG